MSVKSKKLSRSFFLFLITAPLAFLYSCSAGSSSININDYTAREIISSINTNSARMKSLKGDGIISIDTPDMSSSGSFSLSIVKPDSLYIKLEGPFGVSVAAILLERKNFTYYNIQDNKVIIAPTTPANINAVMRLKLDFDDFINGFSGSYNFPDTNSENFSLEKNNGDIMLVQKSNDGMKKYSVQPEKKYIKQYSVFDKDGIEKMVVDYDNFTEVEGFYFPTKIKISKNITKEYVFIEYSSKELNKGYLNAKIKYPKSAKVIQW